MSKRKKMIQLNKVIGTEDDTIFALVNIMIRPDDGRACLFKWDNGSWKELYRDNFDVGIDCAILPGGAIVIARFDGKIVILGKEGVEIVQTLSKTGFSMHVLSDNNLLMVGTSISIFNIITKKEELISSPKREWSRAGVVDQKAYIVGLRGAIAILEGKELKSLASPVQQNLTSVVVDMNGNIVIGGWQGTVLRQIGSQWENISLIHSDPVLDLILLNSTIFACGSGVYSFDEGNKIWKDEISPSEEIWSLTKINNKLFACHTYSGRISVFNNGRWSEPYPKIM